MKTNNLVTFSFTIFASCLFYNPLLWGGEITAVNTPPGSGLMGGKTTGDVNLSIQPGGITNSMLAPNAVSTEKIGNGSINTDKIADWGIRSADLGDGSVTLEKISSKGAIPNQVLTYTGTSLSWKNLPLLALPYTGTNDNVPESFSIRNGYPGGSAIVGRSNTGFGVRGEASGGDKAGVYGSNKSKDGYGIWGENPTTQNRGYLGGREGVFGTSSKGTGVFGMSSEGTAVWGQSTSGDGIYGSSFAKNKSGVIGLNQNKDGYGVHGSGGAVGVYGESSVGNGVKGLSNASKQSGVSGMNSKRDGVGVIGINNATYNTGILGGFVGVLGQSNGDDGVQGQSAGAKKSGVSGSNSNKDGYGVFGGNTATGSTGYLGGESGVYGKAGKNGEAARFIGKVVIANASETPVIELGEGLDYAEGFNISSNTKFAPGSVLVIDPENPGKLTRSNLPYDSRVAGIVAGAKGLDSGVRLGNDDSDLDVALAGRVYCNVDSSFGEVSPGSLLTTSSTPGYAMVATDRQKSPGAILGKAMERLPAGKKAQILVLVTLQ